MRLVDDRASFAASCPNEFLDCRTLGHRWGPIGTVTFEARVYTEPQACDRCDATREARYDERGYLLDTPGRRTYADGYLAAGMTMSDRAGRAAVRLERLQRRMPRMRQAAG